MTVKIPIDHDGDCTKKGRIALCSCALKAFFQLQDEVVKLEERNYDLATKLNEEMIKNVSPKKRRKS